MKIYLLSQMNMNARINENDAWDVLHQRHNGLPKGVLYSHRSTYLHASNIISPNAGNFSNEDTLLLIVPQFHVLWGFPYLCLLSGSDMVLPSNLQPEAIINILKKRKITKEWRPNIYWGLSQ
jgi:fatty-acyl-CoA synthase